MGEMSGMKGGAERAKARRDVEGVSEGDEESQRREIKIRGDEGQWMKVTVMEEITAQRSREK